jgi:hypothetical protein
MGGASSRFHETDWDSQSGRHGGLKDATETLDGNPPTSHHVILTLKKSNLVNQRDFTVMDDQGIKLYTSQPVSGTMKCFDLMKTGGEKLFRIQTDSLRTKWEVYSYKPTFAGQQVDAEATKGNQDAPLYRKARIAITWNKYHGNVYPYIQSSDDLQGVAQEESILKVEEINSITAQYQSFYPKVKVVDEMVHPPLTGWWVWENTLKTHQMKMHLAKGSDIALHCILAISTNMVNVEKKAMGVL